MFSGESGGLEQQGQGCHTPIQTEVIVVSILWVLNQSKNMEFSGRILTMGTPGAPPPFFAGPLN